MCHLACFLEIVSKLKHYSVFVRDNIGGSRRNASLSGKSWLNPWDTDRHRAEIG